MGAGLAYNICVDNYFVDIIHVVAMERDYDHFHME